MPSSSAPTPPFDASQVDPELMAGFLAETRQRVDAAEKELLGLKKTGLDQPVSLF